MILYRFSENIGQWISVNRYVRLNAITFMQRVWIGAIRRLMAERGWNQQRLAEASGVRANTISDLLNEDEPSDPRMDTMIALAQALGVPLWGLFVSAHEHAMFSQQAKQDEVDTAAAERTAAVTESVMKKLAPMVEALIAAETGQPLAQAVNQLPARPVPVQKSAHKRKTGK